MYVFRGMLIHLNVLFSNINVDCNLLKIVSGNMS